MGRPIGSMNRQKPFTNMLRVALLSGGGRRLRIIAERLAEKAEQGDLQAIQHIADRLYCKCAQTLSEAKSRWKCCPTLNCSRSFAGDQASRSAELPANMRSSADKHMSDQNALRLGTDLGTSATVRADSHYKSTSYVILMAERVGFEPTVRFPAHTLSKRAP